MKPSNQPTNKRATNRSGSWGDPAEYLYTNARGALRRRSELCNWGFCFLLGWSYSQLPHSKKKNKTKHATIRAYKITLGRRVLMYVSGTVQLWERKNLLAWRKTREERKGDRASPILSLPFPAHATSRTFKGDVTRDDLQRRFFAQHSVAMLEQCCSHFKQCRNNVTTLRCAKKSRCESSRVTSP